MKTISPFRAIADEYNKTHVIKKINPKTKRVYRFIKLLAERGLYSVKYSLFLSADIIKELENSGIKVTPSITVTKTGKPDSYKFEW